MYCGVKKIHGKIWKEVLKSWKVYMYKNKNSACLKKSTIRPMFQAP